jgi:hypothetical protein
LDNRQRQQAICDQWGAKFAPPDPGLRVGIALATLDRVPLNGLRIAPEGNTCGWFLWGGPEGSEDPDFFQPLCVEHLEKRCPLAVPFLALPPGWGFLTDGEYVDVWEDPKLLQAEEA